MYSIIIPIHEFNETVGTYLSKALLSIERQKNIAFNVIIVFPTKIAEDVNLFILSNGYKEKFGSLLLKENEGNFDFQSQINLAVEDVKTEYFSILEFDDEYSEIYFKNVDEHIAAYPEVSTFLPMTIQVDKWGKGLSLMNDAGWAREFVGDDGEQGFLSVDAVKAYTAFAITGGVFKTEQFKTYGKLKKNIQLTFGYEYLLRILNLDLKVMIIPRVGYKHVVDRDNSLFVQYTTAMNLKTRKFWFDTANKEYYFTTDRDIDLSAIDAKFDAYDAQLTVS